MGTRHSKKNKLYHFFFGLNRKNCRLAVSFLASNLISLNWQPRKLYNQFQKPSTKTISHSNKYKYILAWHNTNATLFFLASSTFICTFLLTDLNHSPWRLRISWSLKMLMYTFTWYTSPAKVPGQTAHTHISFYLSNMFSCCCLLVVTQFHQCPLFICEINRAMSNASTQFSLYPWTRCSVSVIIIERSSETLPPSPLYLLCVTEIHINVRVYDHIYIVVQSWATCVLVQRTNIARVNHAVTTELSKWKKIQIQILYIIYWGHIVHVILQSCTP